MKKRDIIKEVLLILLLLVFVLAIYNQYYRKGGINSFEECIAAGYPAMESYPRQCRDPIQKKTFTEYVEDWKLDGIQLMQHETEGYYGCFGCSTPSEEPAICIDPILEMKSVEETSQRYCNSDFEVVEG